MNVSHSTVILQHLHSSECICNTGSFSTAFAGIKMCSWPSLADSGKNQLVPCWGYLPPHGGGEGLWPQGAHLWGAGPTLASAVQRSIPEKVSSSGEITLVSSEWVIYTKTLHFTGDRRLFIPIYLPPPPRSPDFPSRGHSAGHKVLSLDLQAV